MAMRVFLTGATGYVGTAVLDALLRAGHEVSALVRSSASGDQVSRRGAHPVPGNLRDPESYQSARSATTPTSMPPSMAGRTVPPSRRNRSKRSSTWPRPARHRPSSTHPASGCWGPPRTGRRECDARSAGARQLAARCRAARARWPGRRAHGRRQTRPRLRRLARRHQRHADRCRQWPDARGRQRREPLARRLRPRFRPSCTCG